MSLRRIRVLALGVGLGVAYITGQPFGPVLTFALTVLAVLAVWYAHGIDWKGDELGGRQ